MKRLTQFLVASCFCVLFSLPLQSFAASTNHAENISTVTKQSLLKEKKGKKILKSLDEKFKKWFKKSDKVKDDNGEDIGTWTWVSMGLIVGALLFPPLAIPAVITSLAALRKNKTDENLGTLDRALAITTLVLGIIGTIVSIAIIGIFALAILGV